MHYYEYEIKGREKVISKRLVLAKMSNSRAQYLVSMVSYSKKKNEHHKKPHASQSHQRIVIGRNSF